MILVNILVKIGHLPFREPLVVGYIELFIAYFTMKKRDILE